MTDADIMGLGKFEIITYVKSKLGLGINDNNLETNKGSRDSISQLIDIQYQNKKLYQI